MSQTVTCPLCGNKMELKELESPRNGREDKAYIWICEECPGILLEWWDDTDTEAFVRYMHPKKGGS